MKLKLIVVSMSLMGLISSPALAANSPKHAPHSKTSSSKYHSMKKRLWGYLGYKDKDSWLLASHSKNYKDCGLNKASIILNASMQNTNRAMPDACQPGWFDRISFSGGINFDGGKWGNRNVGNPPAVGSTGQGYTGENTDKYSLNDAYLNIAADPSDWAHVFMSLSFLNASDYYSTAYQTTANSLVVGDNNNKFNLQQGYIRLGNFTYSPVYVELGQQFQDFGRYEIHPITESLTQALSETLRTSIKVGYLRNAGFNASVYSFQDPDAKIDSSTKNFNYGAALGFARPGSEFGYSVGLGYLYNIQGVNLIGNRIAYSGGTQLPGGVYHTRVAAVALYADLNVNSIALSARYTVAGHRMDALDLPLDLVNPLRGAKPWAAGVQASYGFSRWSKDQNIYAGYQVSRETVYLNFPRSRLLLGYGINVLSNTAVSTEWDHDIAYPIAKGGTPQGNSNLVSLRLAVKFG